MATLFGTFVLIIVCMLPGMHFLSQVAIGPAVGEGAFSTVYIGKYFGDVVAVKKQTRQGRDLEKYLLRELSVLKYIRHQNMLEYIG